MSVLLALVAGNGATVPRGKLLDSVWPNQEVSDDVLTGCISTLRRALGDDPRKHLYIETVPKNGYRLVEPVRTTVDASVAADNPVKPALTRRYFWAWVCLLAAALIVSGWWNWHSQSGSALPKAGEHSIAVLPFDVLSDRIELAYFASGLEEELIHQLASDPGLHVIARTSSARFGENTHSIREISEQLGVRHIIEGSVRDSQGGMRITVQLIDTETEAHLWSRVFDSAQNKLIDVQEQVSQAVGRLVASAGSQGQAISQNGAATPSRHPVPDAAYRLFLLGEAHMRVGTADAYVKAGTYFSDAVRIAPAYAMAWSRQAAAYLLRYQYAGLPLEEASALAERSLKRALKIDPNQPEALATLGLMHTYKKQYQQAEAYFERALEQQPKLRFGLHNYGFALWRQSKFKAALVPLRQALKLDPLSGVTNFLLADSLGGLGDFEGSMAQYRHCMDVLPEHHACALGVSTLQRLTGDYQGAVESLERAASLAKEDNFWQLLSSGMLSLQMNELESSANYLDRAGEIFPRDYTLLRSQLQLSLATGKFEEFMEAFEALNAANDVDPDLGLISGLAYFHASDCGKALESYQPHLEGPQSFLVDFWDAEAGFSHAVVLTYCYDQIGDPDKRDDMLARLRLRVEAFPVESIFAQRYLAANYFQLSGQRVRAQHELDRLREDGWPLFWIIERQPVFSQEPVGADS